MGGAPVLALCTHTRSGKRRSEPPHSQIESSPNI